MVNQFANCVLKWWGNTDYQAVNCSDFDYFINSTNLKIAAAVAVGSIGVYVGDKIISTRKFHPFKDLSIAEIKNPLNISIIVKDDPASHAKGHRNLYLGLQTLELVHQVCPNAKVKMYADCDKEASEMAQNDLKQYISPMAKALEKIDWEWSNLTSKNEWPKLFSIKEWSKLVLKNKTHLIIEISSDNAKFPKKARGGRKCLKIKEYAKGHNLQKEQNKIFIGLENDQGINFNRELFEFARSPDANDPEEKIGYLPRLENPVLQKIFGNETLDYVETNNLYFGYTESLDASFNFVKMICAKEEQSPNKAVDIVLGVSTGFEEAPLIFSQIFEADNIILETELKYLEEAINVLEEKKQRASATDKAFKTRAAISKMVGDRIGDPCLQTIHKINEDRLSKVQNRLEQMKVRKKEIEEFQQRLESNKSYFTEMGINKVVILSNDEKHECDLPNSQGNKTLRIILPGRLCRSDVINLFKASDSYTCVSQSVLGEALSAQKIISFEQTDLAQGFNTKLKEYWGKKNDYLDQLALPSDNKVNKNYREMARIFNDPKLSTQFSELSEKLYSKHDLGLGLANRIKKFASEGSV